MDTGRRNLNLGNEALAIGTFLTLKASNLLSTKSTISDLHRSRLQCRIATSLKNRLTLSTKLSTSTNSKPGSLKSSILAEYRNKASTQNALLGLSSLLPASSRLRNTYLVKGSSHFDKSAFEESQLDEESIESDNDQQYRFDWPSEVIESHEELFIESCKNISEAMKQLLKIRKTKNDFVNAVCSSLVRAPKENTVDEVREDLLRLASDISTFDPEFVLKMALYARQELNIRSTANLLVAYGAFNERCRPFLKRYFDICIVLPSDWINVADLYKSFGNKSLNATLRKVLVDKFVQFDEYQLAKYNKKKRKRRKTKSSKSDTKSAFTLKELVRMLHIQDPAEHVMALIGKRYPLDAESFRRSRLSGTWDPTKAGQRMKLTVPQTWETQLAANGNQCETWERLLDNNKLPYMAMLRNVRNLILASISEDHHARVLKQLSNKWAVIKSRQFPHRFLAAQAVVSDLIQKNDMGDNLECRSQKYVVVVERRRLKINRRFKAARNQCDDMVGLLTRYQKSLDRAMDIAAFFNVPPIEGVTLLLVDTSFYMTAGCMSAKGIGRVRTLCDMALLLSRMCSRVCEQSDVSLFCFLGVPYFQDVKRGESSYIEFINSMSVDGA